MVTTVPGKSCKKRCSQATDSASRWFVGSSRSNISGADNRRRHKATRRRSPPDNFVTSAPPSGTRNASIAISALRSRSQASIASIFSCNSACSAMTSFISSSVSSSAKRADTSLKRSTNSLASPMPDITLPWTSMLGSNSGSCARYPTCKPSAALASPVKSVSMPAIIFNKVDLPAPFRPSTPILAPGRKDKLISRNTSLPPG